MTTTDAVLLCPSYPVPTPIPAVDVLDIIEDALTVELNVADALNIVAEAKVFSPLIVMFSLFNEIVLSSN